MVLSLFSVTGAITAYADVTQVATADAFKTAVANGGEVQLTDDFTLPLDNSLLFYKELTLDLNGHTLTVEQTGRYSDWDFYAPVTIKDGAVSGGGKIIHPSRSYCFIIMNGGSLTLEGGTLEFTNSNNCGIDVWDGPFTMTGGTINSAKTSVWRDGSNVTISGGTVIGDFKDSSGEIDITGGSFSSDPTSLLTAGNTATKVGDFWIVNYVPPSTPFPTWIGTARSLLKKQATTRARNIPWLTQIPRPGARRIPRDGMWSMTMWRSAARSPSPAMCV